MLLSSEPEDGATEDVDDIETMKAASGTLAIVSTGNRAVCGKILRDAPGAIDILLWLVANPIVDLQIRGVTIVRNILDADKEFAEQLIGTPVFEVKFIKNEFVYTYFRSYNLCVCLFRFSWLCRLNQRPKTRTLRSRNRTKIWRNELRKP